MLVDNAPDQGRPGRLVVAALQGRQPVDGRHASGIADTDPGGGVLERQARGLARPDQDLGIDCRHRSAAKRSIRPSFPRRDRSATVRLYTERMQYTIRGVPAVVDDALRERARAAGKSLNEVVVDALAAGAGVTAAPPKRRDLSEVAGAWKTDEAVEAALAAQDEPDEDLWK